MFGAIIDFNISILSSWSDKLIKSITLIDHNLQKEWRLRAIYFKNAILSSGSYRLTTCCNLSLIVAYFFPGVLISPLSLCVLFICANVSSLFKCVISNHMFGCILGMLFVIDLLKVSWLLFDRGIMSGDRTLALTCHISTGKGGVDLFQLGPLPRNISIYVNWK